MIGANPTEGWASMSHLPALAAGGELELAAVCTTRAESAAAAAAKYGVERAFADYRELLERADVDAVSVVVRVPSHYEPTRAALDAGKHVYTEWPLGRTTAEAEELSGLARRRGVQTCVGLQARAAPGVLHLKELVEEGFTGEVLACRLSLFFGGVLRQRAHHTWRADSSLGATTLTVAAAHALDVLRFAVADFDELSAVVDTRVPQWVEAETERVVDVTAPDNVLVAGRLVTGATASVHVAHVPWAAGGFCLEVYGREGTLVATADSSPQLGEVRLQGAAAGRELAPLEPPARWRWVDDSMPRGLPYNVGQLYTRFASSIRSGDAAPSNADFDTALGLHRLLDAISESSDRERRVSILPAPAP